jgi:hypothetical protein
VPVIKKLLRFASSIVQYNPTLPVALAYSLAEDAKNVVVTAPATPIAGSLADAYNYFKESVFPQTDDPRMSCRNHMIVFLTDGNESCEGKFCTGGTISGRGPSGDLAEMALPEQNPGERAALAAVDPSVRAVGVPVMVVALGLDPNLPGPNGEALRCIADAHPDGLVFQANNRAQLQAALESIFAFKRTANFFASPSVPAFANGLSDAAHIGAVIPSHLQGVDPNTLSNILAQWSIWSGSLKAFRLDSSGQIPVIADILGNTFPDETAPEWTTSTATRRPVWNAARVLGFTDPASASSLGPKANASPSALTDAVSKAPGLTVWPGRKMIWARPAGTNVPMTRENFTCDPALTGADCDPNLVTALGLINTSILDNTTARLTVEFMRGGRSSPNGSRDEILNDVKPAAVSAIGPAAAPDALPYTYFYQDDIPSPGAPQVRTDGAGANPGYPHKLGDIFHSEPLLLQPPRYFQYLSLNLNGYANFATLHSRRRNVLFVGANDGFFHAFDAGVFDRDATFAGRHDLGTGREIFAFAPSLAMDTNFPRAIAWPPAEQYFVDGSIGYADVFIDPEPNPLPNPAQRTWRTVLLGSLRQGGRGYFALDVTQPDDIVVTAGVGDIVGGAGARDQSPGCLNGGFASCNAGATVPNRQYPEVLWELSPADEAAAPFLGETWSRPVLGRIRINNASDSTDTDRHVAIFGGGFDPSFPLGGDPVALAPNGRAFYIVDVETGRILYKIDQGLDGGGGSVAFAPMPAAPAVADYDDDGYLDIVYIGDVNGKMWRIDLTQSGARGVCNNCQTATETLTGYAPFLLYDGSATSTPGCGVAPVIPPTRPIFVEAGIVYVTGGVRPTLGVAFGTGDRSELINPHCAAQRFNYVLDKPDAGTGTYQITATYDEDDLMNITPAGGTTPGPVAPTGFDDKGFRLDFKGNPSGIPISNNEKTVSTVTSTNGFLTLITFTPDAQACAIGGSSFQYRFFFLTGAEGYNFGTAGTFDRFRVDLGQGLASGSQSTSPTGDTIDTILFSGGAIQQDPTPGSIRTLNTNWKEEQP